MKNILYIQSSPRGPQSYSQKVAQSIVDELKTRHPGASVVVRDLTENPPPHVGQAFVGAVVAGIAAYLAVRFLTRYFENRTLLPFAVYCFVAGLLSVVRFI